MKYEFKHIVSTEGEWQKIESVAESTCFHTQKWCTYSDRIGYRSYVVEVSIDGSVIGYFIGARIWRGVWMLTAPFEGTGTYTQGLVMRDSVSERKRVEIYRQLTEWAFTNHVAAYLQVDDWQLRRDSATWIPYADFHQEVLEEMGLPYEVRPTLYLDMAGKTVEELWSMQHYKSCKYSVNKARKLGLYVRQITDKAEIPAFLDKHYDQLVEVCAKQGMKPKPSQAKSRMLALCESLYPDKIIMLECRGNDADGVEQVMSTGLFCPGKVESVYWTGASYQRYQKFCPNELMVWEAIRLLQQQGAGGLNFGGMADYKLKFGTIYAYVPRIYFTKYAWVYDLKTWAKHSYHSVRFRIAKIRGRKSFK